MRGRPAAAGGEARRRALVAASLCGAMACAAPGCRSSDSGFALFRGREGEVAKGAGSAKPGSEGAKVSSLEETVRRELGRPHGGAKAALAAVAGREAEALPLARAIAEQPGPDALRVAAVTLFAELLVRAAPPLTSPSVLASPAYVPGTQERDAERRRAHDAAGRAALAKLAHDPSRPVAVAAATALLGRVETGDRAAVRRELAAVDGPLAAAATHDPDAARALLVLRGGPQAAAWLDDLAAARPIPVDERVLTAALVDEPVAAAWAPAERRLAAERAMQAGFRAPARHAGSLADVGDPVERARDVFRVLAAIDPTRARAVAERAPSPDVRAALVETLVEVGIQRLTAPAGERATLRTQWAPFEAVIARRADAEGGVAAVALLRLRGSAEAVRILDAHAAGQSPPVDVATAAEQVAAEPTPAALAPVEALLRATDRRSAGRPLPWFERPQVERLAQALAAVDPKRASAMLAAGELHGDVRLLVERALAPRAAP